MKAVREKFLTVVEAEKVTGVHYTVNHSGKMEGMQSLSTSCLCNEYCKNRSSNSELVCSHCYAQRQMKRYKNLNACLERNTEILTSRILKEAEIPMINASFFRFESFGATIRANPTKIITPEGRMEQISARIRTINILSICFIYPILVLIHMK